jgi:hypothetical protein
VGKTPCLRATRRSLGKDRYSENAVTLAKALATTQSNELTAAAR